MHPRSGLELHISRIPNEGAFFLYDIKYNDEKQ